jgi:hypothetical protein
MDKWLKDILPDKDPYHNRGRDQMRKRGGPEFESLCPYLGTFVILFDIDTYFTKFVKEDFVFAKVNLRKGSISHVY